MKSGEYIISINSLRIIANNMDTKQLSDFLATKLNYKGPDTIGAFIFFESLKLIMYFHIKIYIWWWRLVMIIIPAP